MPAERTKSWHHSEMSCNQLVWTAPVAGLPCPELLESSAQISEIDFDDGPPPLVDAPPPPPHYPLGSSPPSEFILFPPADDKSAPATKRTPHSKKKPENHIPRPPNAFILFRSSFIKQQHVSQEVETNHSTLSKIIGIAWKSMPEIERQKWHAKAKEEQEAHRRKFPKYAFKPQQAKGKGGTGSKRKVREVEPKDLKRCAKIAELLVQGMKGKELDNEIAEFDKHHVPEIVTRFEAPITECTFRRASSAPIPDTELTIEQQSFLPKEKPEPRKVRSFSARPTRCPTPQVEVQPIVDAIGESQPAPLKEENFQDFSAFSFDNVGSPVANFVCDPLVEPFPTSLTIDTSFMGGNDWSQCSSPMTPEATPDFLATPSPSPSFATPAADPFGHAFEKSFDYSQAYPMVYQQQSVDGLYNDAFLDMGASVNGYQNVQLQQLEQFGMDSFGNFTSVPQFAF
ncbi:hypothetical protein MD484_g6081, partial [Candolleomyces efflorescens]